MIGEGMKVRFCPTCLSDKLYRPTKEQMVTARVVYINWEHKYFTAEWEVNGRKFRESFKFCDIGQAVTVIG